MIRLICLSVTVILISFILIDMLSNPLVSLRAPNYVILAVLIAIFINILIGMLQYLTAINWKFYLFQWTATLILPFMIISFLEVIIKDNIFKITQEKIVIIIARMEKNIDTNFSQESLNFSLWRGDNIYMLKTIVPSIDIDGETIFYDSRNKKTYHFHNDMFDYYKDKQIVPIAIKRYVWLTKNTKFITNL